MRRVPTRFQCFKVNNPTSTESSWPDVDGDDDANQTVRLAILPSGATTSSLGYAIYQALM